MLFNPEPYDSLFARLSRFIDSNHYEQTFDSLSYYRRKEHCFNIVDIDGSFNNVFDTCKNRIGEYLSVTPTYIIPSGKRMRAFYHIHQADSTKTQSDTTTRSGPSGDDVVMLYDALNYDPPVVCIVDCGPIRYFLVIENKLKANLFLRNQAMDPCSLEIKLLAPFMQIRDLSQTTICHRVQPFWCQLWVM